MNRVQSHALLTLSAFCVLAVFSATAKADSVTLQLEGAGSNQVAGDYAYPYFFSVNGGPGTTPLMCISFDNEIYFGESWTATLFGLSGAAEDEAAWLLNDANLNPGNADADQLAAWSLFAGDVPTDAASGTQFGLAEAFVAANPSDSGFYGHFTLYTPVSGSQSEGGYPQTFIGESSGPIPETITPEPSGLILLGSGLIGCAGRMYRRRRQAQQRED